MRVWAISDTHGMHEQLIIPENVDMVIHSGDFGNSRNIQQNYLEAHKFIEWFDKLPYKTKILVAGNHDVCFAPPQIKPIIPPSITYLHHQETIVDGVKIFGSPYTLTFGTGWAFNVDPKDSHKYWNDIPPDTNILVTHGPPYGMLDMTASKGPIELCGDVTLWMKIRQIMPSFHIFGHIHNGFGLFNQGTREFQGTTFINASCVTDGYFKLGLTSNGVVFEIE